MSPVQGRRNVRTASLLAWLRLVRVFQKVDRASTDSLRYRQLSPAQLDVLAKVGSSEGISQQELADALLVTKGNVCQLLDKMETSGLLERRPDRRVNRLFLTDQGRQVFDDVVPRHDALLALQFRSLSDADQRELLRLLRQLDHSLA
ncbi:MAG TPA: MarR family transcriptional regulator [Chloroflexota bacterium]|nr:MarR family transcriptional regulator [Chloroflexota bacterium]